MGVQINGSEGNVIATKGTFSGDVGIGGTLTYEDVTNIDSVGLITARTGIEIGARPGVAASISVDGNAIFSGITTVGGNIKVGSGITLSPDGNIFATGITTFGVSGSNNPNADGGQIELGGTNAQLQIFAGSQVGLTTFIFGTTQVGSAVTDMARFDLSNKNNGGLSISMDDDSNISYIRHRDNGGNLGFMLRHGAQNRERVRIQSNGRVGIGISNPDTLLHIKVEEQTAKLITLNGDDSRNNYIGINAGDNLEIAADEDSAGSSSSIRFRVDGNEAVRITSDKQLYINTSATDTMFGIKNTGSLEFITCRNTSDTLKYYVHHSGNNYNTNGNYSQISDQSLKENIVDAKSQWNDIKNIKIRNFNFTEASGYDTHTQIGCVAQEVETVSPKLVTTPREDGIKTVSNSVLYMKGMKALQEAMTRIETLEAKVAALEGS